MVSGKLRQVNKILLGIASICILWSCNSETSATSKSESFCFDLQSGDIIYRQGNGQEWSEEISSDYFFLFNHLILNQLYLFVFLYFIIFKYYKSINYGNI